MTDGNIQAAHQRLRRAVDRLCGLNHRQVQHRMVSAPSLYDQLCANLAGTQGDNKTPAKSLPPLWIDAAMLKQDIDRQTRRWKRAPRSVGTSVRLTLLADQTWRPQDTDHVNTMVGVIVRWADSITGLLDPQSVKHLSYPCPTCGRKTVYHRNSAGETVRSPALKITATGCACGHCDAHWPPENYLFLCKLLGFALPEGVADVVEVGS